MAGLRPVKNRVLRHGDAQIVAESVDHRGPHTARRGGPGDDHRVAVQLRQQGNQWRGKECAGFLLAQHDVAGLRRKFGDDAIAVAGGILAATPVLAAPAAAVPAVVAGLAQGVDDRNAALARDRDESRDLRHRKPCRLTAGRASA